MKLISGACVEQLFISKKFWEIILFHFIFDMPTYTKHESEGVGIEKWNFWAFLPSKMCPKYAPTVLLSYGQNKKNVPEVWHMGSLYRPFGQTIFINFKKIKPHPKKKTVKIVWIYQLFSFLRYKTDLNRKDYSTKVV